MFRTAANEKRRPKARRFGLKLFVGVNHHVGVAAEYLARRSVGDHPAALDPYCALAQGFYRVAVRYDEEGQPLGFEFGQFVAYACFRIMGAFRGGAGFCPRTKSA